MTNTKCTCGSASVGSPGHSDWCDINTPTADDDLQLTLSGPEAWINSNPSNPLLRQLQKGTGYVAPTLPQGYKKPIDQQTTKDFVVGMKVLVLPTHPNSTIYYIVAIYHQCGLVHITKDFLYPSGTAQYRLPGELEIIP